RRLGCHGHCRATEQSLKTYPIARAAEPAIRDAQGAALRERSGTFSRRRASLRWLRPDSSEGLEVSSHWHERVVRLLIGAARRGVPWISSCPDRGDPHAAGAQPGGCELRERGTDPRP